MLLLVGGWLVAVGLGCLWAWFSADLDEALKLRGER